MGIDTCDTCSLLNTFEKKNGNMEISSTVIGTISRDKTEISPCERDRTGKHSHFDFFCCQAFIMYKLLHTFLQFDG